MRTAVALLALALLPATAEAATSSPDDPFFTQGDQWALSGAASSIQAPSAWCVSTGAGVTVADVDTGADLGHPDLAGKLVAGARFTDGNGNPSAGGVQDDNGHGTMTTGIIGAATDNATGIAAVAPDARMLIVKVLDSNGGGYDNDVAAGIEWASENGARVINLSIGPDVPFTASINATSGLPQAITDADGRGTAVAIAAGNDGLFLNQYDASEIQKHALVVGALAPDGSVAGYSDGATIYAPGGSGSGGVHSQVVSTGYDTSSGQHVYTYASGTSFATPQVAGVLALLMARGYSDSAARQRIIDTAAKSSSGKPQLDAAAALGATGLCSGTSGGAGPASGPPGTASSGRPAGGAGAAPAQPSTPSPAVSADGTTPGTGSSSHGASTLTPVGGGGGDGTPLVPLWIALGLIALVGGGALLRRKLTGRLWIS